MTEAPQCLDAATIVFSAAALAAWTVSPTTVAAGAMLIAAAILNLVRLLRWAGERTLSDPLVLILHVAYLFLPAGLMLGGLAAIFPETVPPAAAVHAFGVGVIGSMTLAVMTRATLGHTGRDLRADPGTCAIFVSIVASAAMRIAAAFLPGQTLLLHASAVAWAAAFLGYTVLFGGMLIGPKLAPRQPNRAAV